MLLQTFSAPGSIVCWDAESGSPRVCWQAQGSSEVEELASQSKSQSWILLPDLGDSEGHRHPWHAHPCCCFAVLVWMVSMPVYFSQA